MSSFVTFLIAIIMLIAVRGSDGLAQAGPAGALQRVKYAVSCPTCRIEFERIALLGRSVDRVHIGGRVGLERDSRGRFFAISEDHFSVVVFDSTGRFVQSIGRRGDGPAEFGMRSGVASIRIGRGDTLFVFHSENHVDTFTPTFVNSARFALPTIPYLNPYVLGDGTILFSAHISSPDKVGFDLHQVDRNGRIVKSLGRGARAITPTQPAAPLMQFALAVDGRSVWTVRDYQIEQRNLDGSPGRIFAVYDVSWFKPPLVFDTVLGNGIYARRVQRVRAITSVGLAGIDSAGLIWMNASTLKSRDLRDGAEYRIEVFDGKNGTVLASQPIPYNGLRLIEHTNLAYTVEEGADGTITYTVWRLHLRRN